MKKTASFLIVLLGAILFGAACSWIPGANKSAVPPPEGLFPKQMGKFTLSGEAKQSEYGAPDAKNKTYYANYKNAEGNNVECTVTIYDDPLPPASTSGGSPMRGLEEVFKNDAVYIAHDIAIERMNAVVRGERINYAARTDSVPAIKDFVGSLPYDVIKAAPPTQPLDFIVTPPEYDKKITDKTAQQTLMSAIEVWCKGKGLTCSPRPSKTDKSTLLIEARGKTGSDVDKQSDAMVKELKQKSGDALKDIGFRQVAVSLSIEKL